MDIWLGQLRSSAPHHDATSHTTHGSSRAASGGAGGEEAVRAVSLSHSRHWPLRAGGQGVRQGKARLGMAVGVAKFALSSVNLGGSCPDVRIVTEVSQEDLL